MVVFNSKKVPIDFIIAKLRYTSVTLTIYTKLIKTNDITKHLKKTFNVKNKLKINTKYYLSRRQIRYTTLYQLA